MRSTLILNELYRMYDAFNEHYYDNELPKDIIITITQGMKSKRDSFYGKYTASCYDNEKDVDAEETIALSEIQIAGEFLYDLDKLTETMLHEMVHLYCYLFNIKDTNKKYHNEAFKENAESHGLISNDYAYDETNGYYSYAPTEESNTIVDELNIDKKALEFSRKIYEKETVTPAKKRYVCPICGIQAQAKKSTLLMCGIDGVLMDYWDMTNPETPELLLDLNNGLALSKEGWAHFLAKEEDDYE